jgi:hypothetical protein
MASHEEQAELKRLQTRLAKIDAELESARREVSRLDKERVEAIRAVRRFEERQKELVVSEHAMLRYLERVRGVDLEEVKRAILDAKAVELHKRLGVDGKYPADGFAIIVAGGTVTSVTTKEKS